MERPSDIPQDVWDAAEIHVGTWNEHTSIARAVMADRERLAKICDIHASEPDPDETDPYDDYEMGGRSAYRHMAMILRKGVTHA